LKEREGGSRWENLPSYSPFSLSKRRGPGDELKSISESEKLYRRGVMRRFVERFSMKQKVAVVSMFTVVAVFVGATLLFGAWTSGSDNEYTLMTKVGINTSSPQSQLSIGKIDLTGYPSYSYNASTCQGIMQFYQDSSQIYKRFLDIVSEGHPGSASSAIRFLSQQKNSDSTVTESMRIDTYGNLGIGITAPQAKLHVYENTTLGENMNDIKLLSFIQGLATSNGVYEGTWLYRNIAGAGWGNVSIHNGIAIDTCFRTPHGDSSIGCGSVPTRTWWERNPNSGSQMWGHAGSTYMTLVDGKLGIGTTTLPTEKLEVAGNIKASGTISAASYSCTSDSRYKTNITPIGQALQKLVSLNGVFYNWNTEKFRDKNFSKDRQLGFIAQDVEKILPEVVYTDSKGYKSMSYDKLTAIIVEGLKELKAKNEKEIAGLRKENESLKGKLAKIDELSRRLAVVEARDGKRVAR
jgi:hypothetical protein